MEVTVGGGANRGLADPRSGCAAGVTLIQGSKTMKIKCPNCGKEVAVSGLGRKPLNIAVINVCNALQLYRSVLPAANELGCSRAYIYKVLKANGLNLKDVISGEC